MNEIAKLTPKYMFIDYTYDISMPVVVGGLVGYALWTKVAEIAAERIPTLKPAVPTIALIGGVVGAFSGPAVLTINAIALVCLTVYQVKTQKKAEAPGDPLPVFLTDLTEKVKLQPERMFVGVKKYFQKLALFLNKPQGLASAVLVGPSGVGKSNIIKYLASQIAFNRLSPRSPFRNKRILVLDLNQLLTGPSITNGGLLVGQVGSRINEMLRYLKANKNCIIYVDEIHMIRGAGVGSGSQSGDVSNQLKDALTEQGLSIIGATTQTEYNQYIASDPALARRLPPVKVLPPTLNKALEMLKAQKNYFAQMYTGMYVTDAALKAALFFVARDCKGQQPLAEAIELIESAHILQQPGMQEDDEEEEKEPEEVDLQLIQRTIDVQEIAQAHAKRLERFSAERLVSQFQSFEQICRSVFPQTVRA